MQNEILALFGVCIALGMSELLLPGEENGGTRRLLRFLAALAVFLLILTPFAGFLQKSEELFVKEPLFEEEQTAKFEQVFEQAVLEQSSKDLEAGLLALLEKEYGIEAKNCTVLISFAPDGTLARVSIFLSGAALLSDPEEIELELSERLACTVEVR